MTHQAQPNPARRQRSRRPEGRWDPYVLLGLAVLLGAVVGAVITRALLP